MFMRKLRILFSLDRRTLLLFAEAFGQLGLAKLQLLRPFAKVAESLGDKREETPRDCGRDELATLKRISSAIGVMSRYTPWDSKCLVQAVAGMRMLERRRISSTLYLGTSKDEQGKLIAHAWLRSGPLYVSGGEVRKQFVVVEMFARKAG